MFLCFLFLVEKRELKTKYLSFYILYRERERACVCANMQSSFFYIVIKFITVYFVYGCVCVCARVLNIAINSGSKNWCSYCAVPDPWKAVGHFIHLNILRICFTIYSFMHIYKTHVSIGTLLFHHHQSKTIENFHWLWENRRREYVSFWCDIHCVYAPTPVK